MNRHLKEDELLDRIYGLGSAEGQTHLDSCETCAAPV